jgi:hypothetical protein
MLFFSNMPYSLMMIKDSRGFFLIEVRVAIGLTRMSSFILMSQMELGGKIQSKTNRN